MRVRDTMVVGAVTIRGDESVDRAAVLMREQNVGMLVVSGGQRMEGVITDRDLIVRCTGENHTPSGCKVSGHMTSPVTSVDAEADLLYAARLIRDKGIKRLPVTEGSSLTGVLSLTDIAQALDQPLHDVLFGTGKPRRVPVAVLVGRVSHYYTIPIVAALKLEAPLHKGDHLHITGRTTDISLTLDSVEINKTKVEVAYAGDDVAIKVPSRVRPGDSVYVETAARQAGPAL